MRRPSDEPGIAEVLNQDFVDKRVLRQRLNHHHPLLTQHPQDFWDSKHLKQIQFLCNTHSKMEKKSALSPCLSFMEDSYLIVLQTSYHKLRKDDDSGPTHSGAAVDQHWFEVILLTDCVCVSPHRLDLLEVRWRCIHIKRR